MTGFLIEHANTISFRWATWITGALIDTAALVAFNCILWLAIRKRVAPQVGYCLFLLIPLKLLCPVHITVPSSIARLTPSTIVSSFLAQVPDDSHRVGPARGTSTDGGLTPPPHDPSESTQAFRADLLPTRADLSDSQSPSQGTSQSGPAVIATLRLSAIVMAFWFLAVSSFALRFGLMQLRFRARMRTATPIYESDCVVNFRELCRHAGVTQAVRFLESDQITVPAVWGLVRTVIILPCGFSSTLSASEMQWVLLHELAHIRRRDLIIILLQRSAAIVHFFNPAVWIANRIADRLREYACDDFAVSLSGRSGIEAGEAFVQILRNAARTRPRFEGVIGIFGMDSQAACFQRVRRMLDTDRPIRTKPGWLSLCGLILLALASLPSLAASSGQTITESTISSENTANARAASGDTSADSRDENNSGIANDEKQAKDNLPVAQFDDKRAAQLTGKVVANDAQPLAGIEVVALRQNGRHEAKFVTDMNGQFRNTPVWWTEPQWAGQEYILAATDRGDRFGWFHIPSSGARISIPAVAFPVHEPRPFQIKLLPMDQTVSGRVLGTDQKPIAGVRVLVWHLTHAENGEARLFGYGMKDELPFPSEITDRFGRFSMRLPNETQVDLQFLHPDWVVRNLTVEDQDGLGDVQMTAAGRIAGRVALAQSGQPVSGITIRASRFGAIKRRSGSNANRDDKSDVDLGDGGVCVTDADGAYEIGGLYPEEHDVHVIPGKENRDLIAPSMSGISVRAGEMTTLNIALQNGRHVAGRVLDAGSNKPIPMVRIHASVTRDQARRSSVCSAYTSTNERGEFETYLLPGFAQLKMHIRDQDGRTIPGSTHDFQILVDQDPEPIVLQLQQENDGLLRPPVLRRIWMDRINNFVFNPDGTKLVTAGWVETGVDGNPMDSWKAGKNPGDITVWNVANGGELGRFGGEFGAVFDVAVSPDGDRIFTAGRALNSPEKGEVRIWDAKRQEPLRDLVGHKSWVISIAVSPDGKILATGSFDKTVRIWDATSGTELAVLEQTSNPRCLRFSLDGKTLMAGLGKGIVKLWDTNTRLEFAEFKPDQFQLLSCDRSADGSRLVAGGVQEASNDAIEQLGLVHLWDVASGNELSSIRLEHRVSSVEFSPNGRYFATAARVSSIYDADTGEEVAVIRRHGITSSGDKVHFSPDGQTLAVGGFRDVTLWDVSGLDKARKGND